jgi:hypothetical protein
MARSVVGVPGEFARRPHAHARLRIDPLAEISIVVLLVALAGFLIAV